MKLLPSDIKVIQALRKQPMTLGHLVKALAHSLSERSIREVRGRLVPSVIRVQGTGRSAVLSVKPEAVPEVVPVSLPVSGMGGVWGGPYDSPRPCRDQEIAAAAAADVKSEAVPDPLPISVPELEAAALRARIEREEAERDYWRDRNRREQEAHEERGRVSRDEGAHRDVKPPNVPVEPPTPEEEACIKERLEQLKDEGKPARNEPYMRRMILRDVRGDEATKAALLSAAQARVFKLEQQKAKKEAMRPVVMKPADWEFLGPPRERVGGAK